ncbi:hypothetical protein [Microvirga arvi]|uniref:hypothetical protein n=1 Tax=Microvirga arvi TaxID=2778731 RepID=UPI003558E029
MEEVSIVGLNLAKSVYERIMKRFKSAGPTQRFLAVYDQVANLFRRSAHTNAEDLAVPVLFRSGLRRPAS